MALHFHSDVFRFKLEIRWKLDGSSYFQSSCILWMSLFFVLDIVLACFVVYLIISPFSFHFHSQSLNWKSSRISSTSIQQHDFLTAWPHPHLGFAHPTINLTFKMVGLSLSSLTYKHKTWTLQGRKLLITNGLSDISINLANQQVDCLVPFACHNIMCTNAMPKSFAIPCGHNIYHFSSKTCYTVLGWGCSIKHRQC